MTKAFSRRSAVWVLAAGFLACGALGSSDAADAARASQATARPLGMLAGLQATGPHTSLGDQTKVLGRVVGTWDVEYADFRKDGTTLHRTGEFIVAWVLDGRALQDFWTVDPWGKHQDREVYTTLYYFDPKSPTWRASFVDPELGAVYSFTGSAPGNDRFVLDTHDIDSGKQNRWSFNDIRPDSFIWRDEESSDGGKTWRLNSEYHMKRRGGAAPAPNRGAGGPESGTRAYWRYRF